MNLKYLKPKGRIYYKMSESLLGTIGRVISEAIQSSSGTRNQEASTSLGSFFHSAFPRLTGLSFLLLLTCLVSCYHHHLDGNSESHL